MDSGVVGLIVLAVLAGPVLLGTFWIVVLRLGTAPLRDQLARVADAVNMQNEIALDDELQRT